MSGRRGLRGCVLLVRRSPVTAGFSFQGVHADGERVSGGPIVDDPAGINRAALLHGDLVDGGWYVDGSGMDRETFIDATLRGPMCDVRLPENGARGAAGGDCDPEKPRPLDFLGLRAYARWWAMRGASVFQKRGGALVPVAWTPVARSE